MIIELQLKSRHEELNPITNEINVELNFDALEDSPFMLPSFHLHMLLSEAEARAYVLGDVYTVELNAAG